MSPPLSATSHKPGLLIVDDDPLIVETLSFFLAAEFDVFASASRAACIAQLRDLPIPPSLALVDLGLPPRPHRPEEGFALIGDLLAHAPDMKIIVLSGQNDETNARHARAIGATEFIAKPANPALIKRLLLNALSFSDSEHRGKTEARTKCALIGESLPVQRLRTQIRQFSESPFPVLIEGESGSGKEIVATCLHDFSARHGKPYFALNCAAIAPTLVEPTLFGYARGAFTGATIAKSGYFEDAADGTLFLDEIGELPLELQSKLLRVLENGEFQRVGETQTRISRARVIAATNRDLRRELREGRFRPDLYHRLSVFTLNVPPLREMGRDRLTLLDHFRDLYAPEDATASFHLSEEAEQQWLLYSFPGNVRELRNIVIRLTARHAGSVVSAEELAAEFDTLEGPSSGLSAPPPSYSDLVSALSREIQENPNFNLDASLRRCEQAYIEAAQRITHGNISHAARLLGLNRTTLYNRMEALSRNSLGNQ
ncbi:MAG: sigma-54 dependent transcriptional regulator [Georgfuchsia sp.]